MDFKRKTSNSKTYLYSSWPAVSRISWKTIRPTSLKESLVPVGRNPIKIKKLKLQNNNSYLLNLQRQLCPEILLINCSEKCLKIQKNTPSLESYSSNLTKKQPLYSTDCFLWIFKLFYQSLFTKYLSMTISQRCCGIFVFNFKHDFPKTCFHITNVKFSVEYGVFNVSISNLFPIYFSPPNVYFLFVMLCAIWYHLYNLKTWKTSMKECHF